MGRVALYALAILVLFGAGLCAVIFYNTWREKRKQAQMARDLEWRMWIGRVRARLLNVEGPSTPVILDRDAEWFHELWETDFSPGAATEKWLAEQRQRGPSRTGIVASS